MPTANKPSDWNKWEVVLHWGQGGSEFLAEKEYQSLLRGIKDGAQMVVIGDRIFYPGRFALVRPNPEWIDPKELAKYRKAVERKEQYQRMLKNGEVKNFEDYKERFMKND